jgi:Uma2 family endonuclease
MTPSEALEKREWTLQEWLEAELEPLFEYEDGRLIPMAAPTKRHQDIVCWLVMRCAALFVRTGWAQC